MSELHQVNSTAWPHPVCEGFSCTRPCPGRGWWAIPPAWYQSAPVSPAESSANEVITQERRFRRQSFCDEKHARPRLKVVLIQTKRHYFRGVGCCYGFMFLKTRSINVIRRIIWFPVSSFCFLEWKRGFCQKEDSEERSLSFCSYGRALMFHRDILVNCYRGRNQITCQWEPPKSVCVFWLNLNWTEVLFTSGNNGNGVYFIQRTFTRKVNKSKNGHDDWEAVKLYGQFPWNN